ncbi:GntR family transcriptional regulator [Mycolicibacterium sp.]|uniref:GntR family transcriptional regulator n=1 Tax=Mycolicibacterium sp. TaxID=2320850 RepID=UPI003D0E78EA
MTAPDVTSPGYSLRVGRVPAPLRAEAAAVIRRAILEFHFKPGQRLVERELIEQTGVSRTTIREVLRELAAEGLVATTSQKGGVVVVSLTEDEVADLYDIRALLEGFIARRFAEHAGDDQVKGLEEGYKQLAEALLTTDDIQARLDAKDRFYDLLVAGSGNTAIASLHGTLQARVRLARARSLSQHGRLPQTLAEIRAIVDAIAARDPDAAAKAAENHVLQAALAAKLRIRAIADQQAD